MFIILQRTTVAKSIILQSLIKEIYHEFIINLNLTRNNSLKYVNVMVKNNNPLYLTHQTCQILLDFAAKCKHYYKLIFWYKNVYQCSDKILRNSIITLYIKINFRLTDLISLCIVNQVRRMKNYFNINLYN